MASLLTSFKPKRRWMQVSLRTVLVLVTLLCVALSVWIVPLERKRRAVAAIEALDGSVTYQQATTVHLEGLTSLEFLYLNNTQVSDAGLIHLRRLSGLRAIDLQGTRITDAGLDHLQGITNPQWIWLDHSQVTNTGVARLRQAIPRCGITGP
ncbi:MAG TPA: hypothetical protein VFI31_07380 [Pirellulales bacterium]|nr:hypothetical protein [Pirellulales bacterium]